MKKFLVYASYVNYVKTEVEAESIDEAKDIAYELDGGDFKDTGLGDWSVDNIFEDKQ